jgi:hypothetical protein
MLTTIPTIFRFMKASANIEANAVVFMDASLCLASSVGRLNTLDWGVPALAAEFVSDPAAQCRCFASLNW